MGEYPKYLPSPEKIEQMKKKIWEENVRNGKPPRVTGRKQKSKYLNCHVPKGITPLTVGGDDAYDVPE